MFMLSYQIMREDSIMPSHTMFQQQNSMGYLNVLVFYFIISNSLLCVTFTLQLEVRFRGSEHVPAMVNRAQPFRCKFKFEGPAVLDGIKNLGKSGLATVPLPSILTSVSSKARNHFVLQDSSLADKSATRLSQQ